MKKFLSLVFCSLLLFSGCGRTSYFQSTELIAEDNKDSKTPEEAVTELLPEMIYVQVSGAVVNPGVYELPPGSRVFAAIDAAGGLSDSADDSNINLATQLEDGQKIHVLTSEELLQEQAAQKEIEDGLININTASANELMTLSGIGQAKAEQIIAYRNEHGSFSSIDDIKNVSGIGDGIFKRINSQIKI